VHPLAHLIVRAWEQVPVDIEGRLDLRVPHELLDGLRVGPGVDQQRGERVSAVVERDRLEPCRRPRFPGSFANGHRRERTLIAATEYKRLSPASGPQQVLVPVIPQDRQEAASRGGGTRS